MNTLTKPGPFVLVLYGLLTVLAILYAFYSISLQFFSFFHFDVFVYIGLPILIFLIVTFFLDRKLKTKLKRYGFLTAVLFIICILIFPKVKRAIIKDTEFRGQKLVDAIKTYRYKNGVWPKTLKDSFFYDLPKTAIVYRPFYYQFDEDIDGDSSFFIYIYSFDGLKASHRFNSKSLNTYPINWNYSD